jgi:hypothetical protein
MALKIHTLKEESQPMENEVRERIYLTSDKRVVVPEGDKRAAFLLAPPGPVSPAKVKEIKRYRNGANYLHKVGSPKGSKPGGDKAGQPEADKGGKPDADKEDQPEADKGNPALGPDDTVTFGKHEGVKVRDLPERYLNNLVRVSKDHRGWAQAELNRRAEESK